MDTQIDCQQVKLLLTVRMHPKSPVHSSQALTTTKNTKTYQALKLSMFFKNQYPVSSKVKTCTMFFPTAL